MLCARVHIVHTCACICTGGILCNIITESALNVQAGLDVLSTLTELVDAHICLATGTTAINKYYTTKNNSEATCDNKNGDATGGDLVSGRWHGKASPAHLLRQCPRLLANIPAVVFEHQPSFLLFCGPFWDESGGFIYLFITGFPLVFGLMSCRISRIVLGVCSTQCVTVCKNWRSITRTLTSMKSMLDISQPCYISCAFTTDRILTDCCNDPKCPGYHC